MRRLLIAGFVIAGVVLGLIALSRVPMHQLEKVAHLYVAKVHGGRASTLRVLPREPFDENVDRMIAILPFCPSVKEVDLPAIPNLRKRLETLSANPWIISFRLLSGKLDDSDVAVLGKMKQLEWLELSFSPQVTDAGIAHLAGCTKLRVLKLQRTGVTGAGLAKLAECQELETLDLTECPITDETVVLIPHFSKMKNLWLGDITEKGLFHFVTWHRLESFGGLSKTIPPEPLVEFHHQWKAAYDRARAAGEDLPPNPRIPFQKIEEAMRKKQGPPPRP